MDIGKGRWYEKDCLKIYDGRNTYSPLLGEFCGQRIQDVLISTGRSLFVTFNTDDDITGFGFNASVSFKNINSKNG